MKVALITGVTGQDGSYLAELLLNKGYTVHGLLRRKSSNIDVNIEHLKVNSNFKLHYGDMTDSLSLLKIIQKTQPDEIYNLAAQSHVHVSFDVPEYTADADAIGMLRILESVRTLKLEKKCRIYQASTSELYGKVQEVPQNENTPFYPYSPYACAKQYAYWIVKNYREAYNIFAVNGILFNHESERRGENFVTRKITIGVARIKLGLQKTISLGNVNALRDWGYAKDYVECMWLMLQQQHPQDYVIATGEQHSVREFCEVAFRMVGIDLVWIGQGVNEKGINRDTREILIDINPEFYRPTDVETLLGDPTKARTELGWNPSKTNFETLIKLMIDNDLKIQREEMMKKV